MKKLLLASLILSTLLGCRHNGRDTSSFDNPISTSAKAVEVGYSAPEKLIGTNNGHAGAGFGSISIYAHNERAAKRTKK